MFRYALGHYIENPTGTLYHDDNVVIIKDKYPKLLRHYLVIPRIRSICLKHPFDAFRNPEMYGCFAEYVQMAKDMAAESLISEGVVEDTPQLRTELASWIVAGVHLAPSLSHVHIHVITKDMYSPFLKNKKHYNSFTTAFFVDFSKLGPDDSALKSRGALATSVSGDSEPNSDSEFESDSGPEIYPASPSGSQPGLLVRARARNKDLSLSSKTKVKPAQKPGLERRPMELARILKELPLVCTTCGRSFASNQFRYLKAHLEDEYLLRFSRLHCLTSHAKPAHTTQ